MHPRLLRVSAALSLAALAAAAPASAHFVLKSPASWNSQDALGNPQKLGPCGDDGGTPTGVVTDVEEGGTVTITIAETIFHPGHYRVALSVKDRSELPDEPLVTPGSTACGSTTIMSPPVFPVLADGELLHAKPFSGEQTIKVTLPKGVTCDHCTLQVIQFMSEHGLNNPGGCFYHHCADLRVKPAGAGAGGSGTAGSGAGVAGAKGGGPGAAGVGSSTTGTAGAAAGAAGQGSGAAAGEDGGGCACGVPAGGGSALGSMVALAGLARALRRRR